MTITDNYIVHSCPHCGAEMCENEFGSYNTCGTIWWSDGFHFSPSAPSPYIVARCWKCEKAFGRDKAATWIIPEKEYLASGERRHFVNWIGDYAAIREVMGAGDLAPNVERELIVHLIWAGNHKDRLAGSKSVFGQEICSWQKADGISPVELNDYRIKASSMIDLPAWIRADFYREMGDFDQAKVTLEKFKRESPDKYVNCKVVVDALEKRIETKDVKVFEI